MGYFYEIIIEDHLGAGWEEYFEGMEFEHRYCDCSRKGITIISGALKDQAALYGILIKIRDLGLTLVSVKRIR